MIDPKQLNLGGLEQQYGLPNGLLSAVMKAESGGNPKAVSPAGAQGLFQFMPQTAKAYGIDPLDPLQSAVGAARMYGDLSKQFGGDVPSMLAAYNWGSGNLTKKGLQNAPKETRDYIAKILPQVNGQQTIVTPLSNQTTMQVDPLDAEIAALEAELGQQAQGQTADPLDAEIAALEAELGQGSEGSLPQSLLRQFGLTGRHIAEGVAGIADLPNVAVNAGIGGLNALGADIKPLQYPSQMAGSALSKLGVPEPENSVERVVGDMSRALSGAGGTIGGAKALSGAAPQLAKLAEQAGVQARAAIGSSGAAGETRELGGGTIAQTIAGLAGGVAATARSIPKKQVYTADDVAKHANTAYATAEQKGGTLAPQATDRFLNEAAKNDFQTKAGMMLAGDSPTTKILERLNLLKGKALSLAEAQEIDEFLGEQIDSFYTNGRLDKQGKKMLEIQQAFRDTIENARPGDIAGSKEGFEAWKQGRALWSKSMKLRDVERIIARADGSDNPAITIKNGFKALRDNPNRQRGFNGEERKAIRQAARTGVLSNILRLPGSRLIPIIGAGSGSLGTAAAGAAAGVASRGARNALQAKRATGVAEAIAGSKPRDIAPTIGAGSLGTVQGMNAQPKSPLIKNAEKFGRKVTNK